MRFYYNPITSKLEPIGFDGHHGTHGLNYSVEFTSQDLDESGWFTKSQDGPMYKLFFSNQELYLNYVGHLERILRRSI